MPDPNEAFTTFDRGWIVRIQRPRLKEEPPATPHRSLLLLHGWTGDETVMWIFARGVPDNTWIFAPRAPVRAPGGGYGWLPHEETWPKLAEFQAVAGELMLAFNRWADDMQAPRAPVDIMGFSQGAAMAYALAAFYPQQVNRVMALAGYLPAEDTLPGGYNALRGKQIFIAHGSKDKTIPVHFARDAAHILEGAGAEVTYCESEVGHKLSANCLNQLGDFLK